MTDPTVAERMAPKHYECEDSWYSCPLSQEGCSDDRQEKICNCGRDELVQRITTALAEARREVCSNTLAEAQSLGYLDHADACRKGIDSETCTCGIISWLPTAMCGTLRRSRAQGGG